VLVPKTENTLNLILEECSKEKLYLVEFLNSTFIAMVNRGAEHSP